MKLLAFAPRGPCRQSPRVFRLSAGLALGLWALTAAVPARAALMGFTDVTAFQTGLYAAGLSATALDFDALTAGDLIASGSTVDGITFTYDFAGSAGVPVDITFARAFR